MNLEASGGSSVAEFDGAGYSISGLTMSRANTNNQGLFGVAENATIHNLKISGTSIDGLDFVGVVVGSAVNSTIRNVSVSMSGSITGQRFVGGLVGRAVGGSIQDSTFISTNSGSGVTAVNDAGGAIGYAEDTAVDRVGVRANLNFGTGGGVIGEFKATAMPYFSELFYSGTLVSAADVGGLIGSLYATTAMNAKLTGSVVRGDVRTTHASIRPQVFIGQVNSNVGSVEYFHGYSTAGYQYNTSVDVSNTDLQSGSAYSAVWLYWESVGSSALIQLGPGRLASVMVVDASIDANDPWIAVSKPAGVKVPAGTQWVFDTTSVNPWNNGRLMPGGLYNLGFFGSVVDQCGVGTYSATGGVPCELARVGHFVSQVGFTFDVPCPFGAYQANLGSTGCLPVPQGNYVNRSGQSEYVPCPAGQYQPGISSTSCLPARAGSYTSETGSWQDLRCPMGTYQPDTGMTECIAAPAGSYVDELGAIAPTLCPPGRYQPNLRSVSCLLAPAGSYVSITGATASILCGPGYGSIAGATSCSPASFGGGGGGGGAAPVEPVVEKPSLTAQLIKVTAGQIVLLPGANLSLVKSILIGTKELPFAIQNGNVSLTIPLDMAAGAKDLILKSDTASVTIKDAIVVSAPAPKPVAAPIVTFKKSGSKVTVYVTTTTPVSLTVGKKVVAKNLVGVRLRVIVTLPKGKSTLSAKAAGRVIRTSTYLATR